MVPNQVRDFWCLCFQKTWDSGFVEWSLKMRPFDRWAENALLGAALSYFEIVLLNTRYLEAPPFSLPFYGVVFVSVRFPKIQSFLSPMLSVGQQPTSSCLVLHYSYRKESLSVWRDSFFLDQSCLNWINSLISHNSSGHAFSSLLFIFPYAMMEMEYLGSAEFSNYGTNWFHTGGTTSSARTPTVWKISREKVLAPVYPICTQVYSKYPNGVRPSTYWEKGGKSLWSLVSEK